nr:unnamed protein product [Digitaria exilis]
MAFCLSDLPDDVLQRILSFVPTTDAASTSVLSRRWRGLWPTPARAVILDTRSYGHRRDVPTADTFFHGAGAALAAHGRVRSLAVHVEAYEHDVDRFMSRMNHCPRRNNHRRDDGRYVAGEVLGHPACLGVEELTVSATLPSGSSSPETMTARYRACLRKSDEQKITNERQHVGLYKLSLGSIPSVALQVLHIDNCRDLRPPPPATAAFPSLIAVRLRRTAVSLFTLREMIAASPQLNSLRLEHVYITSKVCRPDDDKDGNSNYGSGRYSGYGYNNNNYKDDPDPKTDADRVQTLSCGAGVATLVLLNCTCNREFTIQLDFPGLQSFRYRGYVDRFALKSPPPDLQRADLHFLDNSGWIEDTVTCQRFWVFMKNVSNTKFLKLKLGFAIGDIAIAGKKKRHRGLLCDALLGNLERLEVEGKYNPGSDVAVTIGNLLQCCPVVRDLRLKLNTVDRDSRRGPRSNERFTTTSLERKSELDARKSAGHFARRRNLEVCLGGEGDSDDPCEAADIPGLSDKCFNFNCLRGSLRRVSLQFRMHKKSNIFGTQLVKFFAEKTVGLEEMYIDDGNRKMCEHINRKVAGRAPNTSTQPISEYQVSKGISQRLYGASQLNSEPHTAKQEATGTSFRILALER